MLAKSAAGFTRSASTNSVRGRPSISFRFRRARTSCVPTKPAPPVIKTFIVFLPCALITVLVQLGTTTFETAAKSSSQLPVLDHNMTNIESQCRFFHALPCAWHNSSRCLVFSSNSLSKQQGPRYCIRRTFHHSGRLCEGRPGVRRELTKVRACLASIAHSPWILIARSRVVSRLRAVNQMRMPLRKCTFGSNALNRFSPTSTVWLQTALLARSSGTAPESPRW